MCENILHNWSAVIARAAPGLCGSLATLQLARNSLPTPNNDSICLLNLQEISFIEGGTRNRPHINNATKMRDEMRAKFFGKNPNHGASLRAPTYGLYPSALKCPLEVYMVVIVHRKICGVIFFRSFSWSVSLLDCLHSDFRCGVLYMATDPRWDSSATGPHLGLLRPRSSSGISSATHSPPREVSLGLLLLRRLDCLIHTLRKLLLNMIGKILILGLASCRLCRLLASIRRMERFSQGLLGSVCVYFK